jgi:hypothetical protein
MAGNLTERSDYQCCFCGRRIAPEGDDPILLKILIEEGGEQELYCHRRCLKGVLHASVPLYPARG